jgi:hypothetical protein
MYKMLCVLAFAIVANAQTYTGSIRGRVSDPTGMPVAGAAVSLTETETNSVRKTVTNEVGDYVVSFLQSGDYRVRVSAPSFKESLRGPVRLQLNQSMSLDTRLELGQVTDTVEVSAEATQINTVSPEIGHGYEFTPSSV